MNRDVKPGFHEATNNELGVRTARTGRARVPGGRFEADGWSRAVLLTERWLARGERADSLLEQLTPGLPAQERARAQHLFYGVVRWASRLEAAQAGLMSRAPRTRVRAVLLVAGLELLEGGAEVTAQVVDHAVEKSKLVASPTEARLVNAVARKLAGRLAERPATAALEFAHPEWLVERWTRLLGAEAAGRLLAWNQTPAPVYARWRRPMPAPEFLTPTRWPGFFGLRPGRWDDVRKLADEGALYLQDPATRLGVELLAPRAHETILDACAAPGGKSLMIADAMDRGAGGSAGSAGRLVALDEEGPRLARLKANLSLAPRSVDVALVPADLRRAGPRLFQGFNLPETYDAVLLDAPCSNTGVMRHRVDVKCRLRAGDFDRHAAQQLVLLRAASRLVRPGGRLVYSTCSIDPAENEDVVRQFQREQGGWKLGGSVAATPWNDGHDGAAAFLLTRVAGH